MKLYRIKDWSSAYETHETRKLSALRWVPIPNKHDGLTFRQIGTEKDAAALFAGWILMVQIASKSDRDRRGSLFRNGRPMQARDMALVTGFPVAVFLRALDYFAQPSIGWIVAEEYSDELPLLPGEPGDAPGNPAASPEKIPLNGMEGKEGNGTEGKGAGAPVASLPFASVEFGQAWADFERHRKEIKKKLTPTATKQIFANCIQWGEPASIDSIRRSIANGWQGLFLRDGGNGQAPAGKSEFSGRF